MQVFAGRMHKPTLNALALLYQAMKLHRPVQQDGRGHTASALPSSGTYSFCLI